VINTDLSGTTFFKSYAPWYFFLFEFDIDFFNIKSKSVFLIYGRPSFLKY